MALEVQLARTRAAKERLEEESEDKLCCICQEQQKNVRRASAPLIPPHSQWAWD
jgi:hypothetical protein